MIYYLFVQAILQYYLHQLHEIIHYPALQDVFHCFRELGNAILFFIMIEQSLVSLLKIQCV
jgi:hypothetical protein